MSGKASKPNATSSKAAATTTTTSSNTIPLKWRITQNLLFLWEDANIDQSNKDCQNALVQLQSIVNDVHTFTQRDECIDFLTEVDHMKAYLIIEGSIAQQIVPLIHDIPQLDIVYIFCHNKSRDEQWAKTWAKVKGINAEMTSICKCLQ
jgi:hypothetical protein